MGAITAKDGTQIYYKDWGSGQSIVFNHGCVLLRKSHFGMPREDA
jgi:non-heme chloroperoxidase